MARLQITMNAEESAIFFLPRTFANERAPMAARRMAYYLFRDQALPYAAPGAATKDRIRGEGGRRAQDDTDIPGSYYRMPWSHFASDSEFVAAKGAMLGRLAKIFPERMNAWAVKGTKVDPLGGLEGPPLERTATYFAEVARRAVDVPGTPVVWGFPSPIPSNRYRDAENGFIDRESLISMKRLISETYNLGLNDFRAGIGRSYLNLYARGTCTYFEKKNNNTRAFWEFDVRDVAIRFRDNFDFEGLQWLGLFDSERFIRDVESFGAATGATLLTNKSFRDFAEDFLPRYNAAVAKDNLCVVAAARLPELICVEGLSVCELTSLHQKFKVKLSK
ncbi:hypothetical protein [Sphingobium sp. Ndbn-10]|uniref:hypothetical protein n=1 Tax=Sphingobium sp. Ndbn-10 TaxID=1667223 RepID=UPI00111273E5|nr:hypothetical protein [Sphingobium sp. Ndbn-10]